MNNLVNYAFTIKNIKSHTIKTKEHHLAVAMEMINKFFGELADYAFEYDSINRVHIHGIFKCRKGIRYSLFKKQFWHIHIDPLFSKLDLESWQSYIHKTDYLEAIKNYAFIADKIENAEVFDIPGTYSDPKYFKI